MVDALEDFEQHWRNGREKIVDGARRIFGMVSSTVALYRDLDEQGAAQAQELW